MSGSMGATSSPNSEGFEQRLGTIIKICLEMCLKIVAALKKRLIILIIIFAIGMALVIIRAGFLASVPWMQKHFKLVTAIVDVFITVFTTMENYIGLIITVVKDIIHFFRPNSKSVPPFHGHPYKLIKASTVNADLGLIAATCPPLNSGPLIMKRILQHATQHNLCPLLRSLSVTPAFGAINATLGWASLNSDPYLVNSCQIEHTTFDQICIGLGGGLVIVEILFPALLIALTIPYFVQAMWAIYHS